MVMNAGVGVAGLGATLAAREGGHRAGLATTASPVIPGEPVKEATDNGHGDFVPIDSEHSAILQCIAGHPRCEVRRVILTASGGPFRGWSAEPLAGVSVADAVRHPTWSMGRKNTIDSATLANKALEVIEAHVLFDLPYDRIEVVVHPQ